MVKKLLFTICLLFIFEDLCSQNLSSDEATLTNFAKRVYNVEHFEGVKVFEIDSNKYLVIAVKIEKKTSSLQTLNTIANIKAKSYLSKFQNGSYLSSEIIIINNDEVSQAPLTNEIIKEFSSGFVKGMGTLSIIDDFEPGFKLFFFYAKSE